MDSLSNDNKKNIANDIETFLKNKDMLKAKRDQLSEARTTEEPNTNAFDKLLEMKKKLELLRSQKF